MLVQIPEALITTESEEEAPASGRRRKSEAAPRLSELLWGIRWDDLLPVECAAGVTVHSVSYDEAMSFVRAHYKDIFPSVPGSPFGRIETSPAKERYYRHAADFFEFRKDGQAIALMIGDPIDWASYYIRSTAVVREYQGMTLMQRLFPIVFERLAQAGVERVEADASPSNATSLQILTRFQFRVTGTVLTDRWGALTRFVKFLSPAVEDTFVSQFCAVRPAPRRGER
jgi:RimJ/RimL family protein N-acetyltransferase